MSAPVLESSSIELQVLVHPVDAEADFRHACALTENYAGFLKPDGGEGVVGAQSGKNTDQMPVGKTGQPVLANSDAEIAQAQGFLALEWQGQPFLKAAGGPLEWIRLTENGRVEKGVRCVQECKPGHEVCGWTLRPHLKRVHSVIGSEVGSELADLRPRIPANEPSLEWKVVQGSTWERLIPAAMPLWCGVRHRHAKPNTTFKVRTTKAMPKNVALCVVFNLSGQIYEHSSAPALRFEWGNEYSFVLRGLDGDARPCLEKRAMTEDGKIVWKLWRQFDEAEPLDLSFWRGRHVLRIYRVSGKLVIEWDGKGWWVAEIDDKARPEKQANTPTVPVEWAAASLQLSVFGTDCLLQVGELEFDRTAWFVREAPVMSGPIAASGFELQGQGSQLLDITLNGTTAKARGALHGVGLQNVYVNGTWQGLGNSGVVKYSVSLFGDKYEAPVLCALGVQFPSVAQSPLPMPLDLRPALTGLTLSSGEPGATPSAEAHFDVEHALLDRFYPNWKEALAPFRPVEIKARETPSSSWFTLFRGYLLPDSEGQEGFNSHRLSFIARDPMLRLQAPAALVDNRYAPLDLFRDGNSDVLYGAQGAQHLLEIELGVDEAQVLNGNGDPFRFLPSGHYPLLGATNEDVFAMQDIAQSGSFRLPPPFGEDLKRWIDTLAEYDHAVWFYDASEQGFMYGHMKQFFEERGLKVWHLRGATTENAEGNDSPDAWPLLSQYSRTGWIDHAYTGTQVWGMADQASQGLIPALIVGKYEPSVVPNDTNPVSEKQSWRRTFLLKQEFIGKMADQDYADSQAWRMWQEFGGQPPRRFDFTISDGSTLRARWGEMARWNDENLRIVSVEHTFSFGQNSERLVTHLTARSLSGTGL